MNYFRYQYSGSLGAIWSLFHELKDAQEECYEQKSSYTRCEYGHTLAIVNSAMNGAIFDRNKFSLRNYECTCQKNDRAESYNKSKEELAIVEDDFDKDGGKKTAPNTISQSRVKAFEEAFDMVAKDEDFERSLIELFNIRDEYIIDKGFDPVVLFKNALKGMPSAIKELRRVKDSKLQELLSSLLEFGEAGDLILRLEGI